MAQLSSISRIIAALTKNTNFFNLHAYRFHSRRPCKTVEKDVKERSCKHVHFSINGSNSEYSSVNAVLHIPSPKIAFNCGEGLERIIDKHQLSSIEDIFITRLDWRCLAGLHGALFLLHTSGVKKARVYGPSTLNHLCNKILNNIPKVEFDVEVVDCNNGHIQIWKNDVFRIRAIPLRNSLEQYARVFAYAGEIEDFRSRRINIEKCVDLNVSPGLIVSQLAKGLEVTLDNGTVVRPADVFDYYPKLNFLGKIQTNSE